MEQYWLYIIIGIIYLISNLMKKKEPGNDVPTSGSDQQRRQSPSGGQPASGGERQLTFEELLKEITEGKAVVKEQPKPVQTYVDYDDDLEDEESKAVEVVNYDVRNDDKVVAAYEEAKRMAFVRPSLEETMKLSDTDMEFGKFKEFELIGQRNLLQDYLADLRDPSALKKAVIMSEVLQRKF